MIGTAAAIIGASIIGAGASLAASGANAKAAKNTAASNASAISDAGTQNAEVLRQNNIDDNQLLRDQYDSNLKVAGEARDLSTQQINDLNGANQGVADNYSSQGEGLFKDWIARGNSAGDAINNLLGLSGDSTATSKAFSDWANSVGQKYTLKTGVDAVNSSAATRGTLNSGANLKNVSDYGQKTAQSFFGTYLNDLQTQQSTGLSAANSLSNVYGNAASLKVNSNNNASNGWANVNNNYTASVTGAGNNMTNGLVAGNTNTTNGLVANTSGTVNALAANNNNALSATTTANTQAAGQVNGLLGNAVTAYGYGKGESSYKVPAIKAVGT